MSLEDKLTMVVILAGLIGVMLLAGAIGNGRKD